MEVVSVSWTRLVRTGTAPFCCPWQLCPVIQPGAFAAMSFLTAFIALDSERKLTVRTKMGIMARRKKLSEGHVEDDPKKRKWAPV
jgi:hypothetical protein